MKPIVTAAQMRALDARTIQHVGIPGVVLMENAGRAVADAVTARNLAGAVAVVCGAGNNGGDGFVCARVLRARGLDARVLLALPEAKLRGDARVHYDAYRACDGPVLDISDPTGLARHRDRIVDAAVVVDALFGTGLDRDIDGHLRDLVELMNASRARVIAVDVPSGLSVDDGRVLGCVVDADCTVTMAFHKVATASAPGFAHCGEVRVAEIGIPESLASDRAPAIAGVGESDVRALLPVSSALDYKNRRGHLLAIAGSPGKRGAGRLTARAALRVGAGLSTLAGPEADAGADDSIMTAGLADLGALLPGKSAVAMGPGMDPGTSGRQTLDELLARCEVPMVLDADALGHMAGRLPELRDRDRALVLTPHPGEAGRLLGVSAGEIEGDRVAAVRRMAAESGAVCVLKGARTLVGEGDAVFVVLAGSPALATAGSGDVLTGVIGGLLAQGLSARDAALAGVFLHGRAGELGGARFGSRGLLSSDLPELVAEVLAAHVP